MFFFPFFCGTFSKVFVWDLEVFDDTYSGFPSDFKVFQGTFPGFS